MPTVKTNLVTPVNIVPETVSPVFYSSIGGLAYIEIGRQYNNGDGTGRYITYKYRGSKDALRAASVDWVNAGGKYTINEDGPYPEATVTYSGSQLDPNNPVATPDPFNEEPVSRFEFRTEYIEASLFELPYVRAEAKKYVDEKEYFAAVKAAGDDPKNNKLPMPQNLFPLAYELVKRLSRGQDSFQTSRVSLTRISSYSAKNGLPATPPIISSVFTGEVLAARNAFPDVVRTMMPRAPIDPNLTPDNTVWSWLKTNDSTSLIIKTNQVERNETWTFAAWDLFAYPVNPIT
jgi:hypothetical protein